MLLASLVAKVVLPESGVPHTAISLLIVAHLGFVSGEIIVNLSVDDVIGVVDDILSAAIFVGFFGITVFVIGFGEVLEILVLSIEEPLRGFRIASVNKVGVNLAAVLVLDEEFDLCGVGQERHR